jgi:hypothetical protein
MNCLFIQLGLRVYFLNLAKSDIVNLEVVTIPLQLQRFANSPYKNICKNITQVTCSKVDMCN